MNILIIVLEILIILGIGALTLFIKNFFPSYMDEKGKNLATKEDIAEITRRTETVQAEFKEEFEKFTSDLHFKYDFYYKQYTELYCKLYAIVIQSEYVRYFIGLSGERKISFEDAPFLEISPTHRTKQTIKLEEGKPLQVSQTTEDIETPILQFNKNMLCEYIIDKGDLATQELLKAAVSYRFAHSNYSGNSNVKNSSCEEEANEEEFRLIGEMVRCIVRDYNALRKELRMEYSESELNNGIPIIK